jgi:lipid-binding SYLF domain-containing protein
MRTISKIAILSLLALVVSVRPSFATKHETKTVEEAAEVAREFGLPIHHIPANLLRDATGVAIVPHILNAGVLFDARFGHGVVLVRQSDGSWSNPIFVKLEGIGFGGEAGVESTDLVLVFKTKQGLDHLLHGHEKLILGADVTIAAGPLGVEAEVGARGRRAEIFSYTRSRGLFAGFSVQGAALKLDREANESFYAIKGGHSPEVLAHRPIPAAEGVRVQLARLVAPPQPVHAFPSETHR